MALATSTQLCFIFVAFLPQLLARQRLDRFAFSKNHEIIFVKCETFSSMREPVFVLMLTLAKPSQHKRNRL
jgi:hypothetical protein